MKFIEEPSDSPIFMYIATPSPHRPATPAPQYDNKFLGKLAPCSPSYNDDSKDKHWIISDGMKNMLNDYPYLGVILEKKRYLDDQKLPVSCIICVQVLQ